LLSVIADRPRQKEQPTARPYAALSGVWRRGKKPSALANNNNDANDSGLKKASRSYPGIPDGSTLWLSAATKV